ncbi:MAG: TetR/AcrR family transcriptional regulator [Caldilineaceae bacterium]|nr:TetR/AcrR family transcriptional regulator [Caldilineaceae bacterium]
MSELSPREKRQQRTHQAILNAARQIISEQGLDGLSMRAIAERIDYSPAALYEYFGSKEEIIGALSLQGHRRLRAYMAAVDAQQPFLDHFLGIGLAYIEFAVQYPDLFLLMFTSTTSEITTIHSIEAWLAHGAGGDSSFVLLIECIQRGIDAEMLRVRAHFGLIEMAFAAWSTVHGIAMLRVTHLRALEADFDTISRETLTAFGKGLVLRATGVV